jgi:protein CpxP
MNHRNKIVAGFLAASAVFFGIAHAQGQGPGCGPEGKAGMMRSSMQRGGMMDPAARIEQRLNQFKGELKLNAQQEPLWQAFAEKSKTEAGKGMQAMRERMKDEKALTAPERMAQMQASMKERVTAMDSVNESFTRLYSALTPEQKAAADKHFASAGRHPGLGRGGPRGEGQGGPTAPEARRG